MKIKSGTQISGLTKPEIIGVTNCWYKCKSCPKSNISRSPILRIIGYDKSIFDIINRNSKRFIELASGELPAEKNLILELHQQGIRRLIIPLFGYKEEHNNAVGIDNSFERSIEIMNYAKENKIQMYVIMPVPDQIDRLDNKFKETMRLLMRLCWNLHSKFICYNNENLIYPPCFYSEEE